MKRAWYAERAASPRAYVELFTETFGPIVAIRASLAEEPERLEAFDRELLDFATRSNSDGPNGSAEYRFDYLLVVARRRR